MPEIAESELINFYFYFYFLEIKTERVADNTTLISRPGGSLSPSSLGGQDNQECNRSRGWKCLWESWNDRARVCSGHDGKEGLLLSPH